MNGDGHAALQLGDAWLDGRVATGVRRPQQQLDSTPRVSSRRTPALLIVLPLWRSCGLVGTMACRCQQRPWNLETSASTPLGDHLLGHLYDVIDARAYLIDRYHKCGSAPEQHHADSFVSLARA